MSKNTTGKRAVEAESFWLASDAGDPIEDPRTGNPLVFPAANYPKRRAGALYAAAKRAGLLQRSGHTVLLHGPADFSVRRYSSEKPGGKRWHYQIQCPRCKGWMHPNRTRGQQTKCWKCYTEVGVPPEQREHIARIGRQRRGRAPGAS